MAGIVKQIRKRGDEALTPREMLFLQHYVTNGFNCRQATLSSGAAGTYTLTKNKAKEWIAEHMAEDAPNAGEIIARLAKIMRTGFSDFIDIVDGYPRINWERAKETGAINVLKRLKYNDAGMPEIEFYSALDAAQVLAKVMGLLIDRSELRIDASLKIRVDEVRANMANLMNDPTRLNQAIELAKSLAAAGVGQKTPQIPAQIETTAREA
jgi:hypothetical protein